MPTIKTPAATQYYVNRCFFTSATLTLIGYAIYPDSLKYWGFGLIAILCWLAAFACFIRAVKRMFQQRKQDIAYMTMMDKGTEPISAEMPDIESLKQAGVVYED